MISITNKSKFLGYYMNIPVILVEGDELNPKTHCYYMYKRGNEWFGAADLYDLTSEIHDYIDELQEKASA